jgi:outer membrane lipoprotein-sorting protein
VEDIENYLNSLRSLEAHFIQNDETGKKIGGILYFWRPAGKFGSMRIDYEPKIAQSILADHTGLIVYSSKSKKEDYYFLDQTPAAFILKPKISFAHQEMKVQKISFFSPDKLAATLNTEQGQVTFFFKLGFKGKIEYLLGWNVITAQGNQTSLIFQTPLLPVSHYQKIQEIFTIQSIRKYWNK